MSKDVLEVETDIDTRSCLPTLGSECQRDCERLGDGERTVNTGALMKEVRN